MTKKGYTIIELIIVMTVIAFLIVLGTLNLKDSEINSRDSERRNDMESLSLKLESFYKSGSSSSTGQGKYPSTVDLIGREQIMFDDFDEKSITPPEMKMPALIAATNNTQNADGVLPNPTKDNYIYQPIASDGTLCQSANQECRRFNLYYTNEFDGKINMIMSKNR